MDKQQLHEVVKTAVAQVKDIVVEAVAKVISHEVEKNKTKKQPPAQLNEGSNN
jgi:hypothetical protein